MANTPATDTSLPRTAEDAAGSLTRIAACSSMPSLQEHAPSSKTDPLGTALADTSGEHTAVPRDDLLARNIEML